MDRRIRAALGVAVLATFSSHPAAAQSAGNNLAGASSALSQGNYSAAVTQLNAALASPDIEPAQTAHAMYQRGVAYRKLGQSSRAIADLSAALWLPALPSGDKARAYANRALAYRAVDMSQQADADTASARKLAPGEFERMLADKGNDSGKAAAVTIASKKPAGVPKADAEQQAGEQEQAAAATPPRRERPARPPQAQPANGVSVMGYMAQQQETADNSSEAFKSSAGDEQGAESPPAQEAPVQQEAPVREEPSPYSGVTVAMPSESEPAAGAQPEEQAPSEPQAPAEVQPPAEPHEQQTAEATPEPEAPQSIAPPSFRKTIPDEQAAETPPPARPAVARPSQRAQTPAWQTSVDNESTAAVPVAEPEKKSSNRVVRFFSSLMDRATGKDEEEQTTEKPESAPMAATNWGGQTPVVKATATVGAAAAGTYRLQLASSRSEDDARKLWQRMSAENADLLNGQEPQIEKTDLGSLGTVWRLHIGPFNDKAESLKLCNAFKRSGVDCFLVTR